jgi:UDP-3-O-[3-hydroxymyristoyl] N-acetylglucosamine deacetylase
MKEDFLTSPYGYRVQKTIRRELKFHGIGLHSGVKSSVRLVPAPPNHGLVFERIDLERPVRIPAHYDAVVDTRLATTLGAAEDPSARLSTVEHLLAALFGSGVTNLLIQVDGPEIPILDGSAAAFLDGLWDTGIEPQAYSHRTLKVIKPVKIYQQGAVCELLPRDRLRLTTSIDFAHPKVGRQSFALELTPKAFRDDVCSARTFGFLKDQQALQKMNLALGASVENVLAFSDTDVVNEGGQRYPDECVRHKLLDALGDLALCGSWIEGEMVSFRGGHSIHLAMLKALHDNPTHWKLDAPEPLKPVRVPRPAAVPHFLS